jgi:predicted amidohydrolase YtcJ
VLSGDPLTVAPEALSGISVDMTLLAGRVVFER